MFTQPTPSPSRLRWKKAAIQSAVALTCANAFYMPQASASAGVDYCGPTVSVNTSSQCLAEPHSTTVLTVGSANTPVDIRVTTGAAVYYNFQPSDSDNGQDYKPGDMGQHVEGGTEGGLTNYGTIESNGRDTLHTGIYIEAELLGTLTNMAGAQINAVTESEGAYAESRGVFEDGNGGPMQGVLANHGTISASSTAVGNNSQATAVYVQNQLSSTGLINNTGTLQANATSSRNAYANALFIGGTMDGSIINSGHLQANATGVETEAYGIKSFGQINGTLVNSGTIEATATSTSTSGTAAAYGIRAEGLGAEGVITNSHRILAATSASSSSSSNDTGSGAIGIYFAGTVAGTINNTGLIAAAAQGSGAQIAAGVFLAENFSGTLNNSGSISGASTSGLGFSLIGFSAGTINNQAAGVLHGSIYLLGQGTTVNNAGTIDIPLGGMAAILGNYTQSSTGTLKIAAQSDTPDLNNFFSGTSLEGGYSQLYVGGTATIAGKAMVDVKTVNTLAVGQTLVGVVQAQDLVGNFTSVEDNSAMFNFVARSTEGAGGHIDLEIVRALTATQAASNTANSPSLGAAGLFDNAANSGLQSVVTALGQLSTEAEVSNALRQTLPLLTGGGTTATLSTLGSINGVIQARTAASQGLSSGDVFYGDKNVWLKPFGSWADQGDRNGVSGFKANTAGLVMGVDAAISDTTRVGLAGAYAKASIDSKSSAAPQSADVNVYQLIGYGSYSLGADTEINFQADVGRNTTEGRRTIALTSTNAASKYDSFTTHLGAAIGRSYPLNEKTTMTPSIRADYTRIKDDGYSETGAGVLNLNVASRTTEQFVVGLDGKLNHQLSPSTSVTANVGVGYDTMNQRAAITAAFAGAPGASFVTNGAETSPWLMRAGLGLVHQVNSATELTARYDAEFRDDFVNQTASVKVRWAF